MVRHGKFDEAQLKRRYKLGEASWQQAMNFEYVVVFVRSLKDVKEVLSHIVRICILVQYFLKSDMLVLEACVCVRRNV